MYKARDRKYSLAWICRRAGISSTGYLSDVIAGKRALHEKYAEAIGAAFDLGLDDGAYLAALVRQDEGELARLKRVLSIKRLPLTERITELFFAIEVFCAFGLFANVPTREQLIDLFGKERFTEVDRALGLLLQLAMVKRGDDGRFALLTTHVSLSGVGEEVTFADFIKASLRDAERKVERWAGQRDVAHFESSIVSVRTNAFPAQLTEARSKLAHLMSSMESPEADGLVRVNVQIYPLRMSGHSQKAPTASES